VKHSALLRKDYLKRDLFTGIKVTVVFYLVGVAGKFIIFILYFLVFLLVRACNSHFTVCVIFFFLASQKQPLKVVLYYRIF
jgi:hypothetical protein